jgi:hypothetical protein
MKSIKLRVVGAAAVLAALPAGLAFANFAIRHSGVECVSYYGTKPVDLFDVTAFGGNHDWGSFASGGPGSVFCPVAVNVNADSGAEATVQSGRIFYSTVPNGVGPADCRLWAVTAFPGVPNATPGKWVSPPSSAAAPPTTALNVDAELPINVPNGGWIKFAGPSFTRLMYSCAMPSAGSVLSSIKAMIKGYEVIYSVP